MLPTQSHKIQSATEEYQIFTGEGGGDPLGDSSKWIILSHNGNKNYNTTM